jgi:hypothetical protein
MPIGKTGPLYVRAREPLSHQERGMLGARARWGDEGPRTVRLDELDPDTARLIRALLAQAPHAKAGDDAA